MTPTTTLLTVTARLFGDAVADRIFVPLVADWQREWRSAPSTWQRAVVLGRGAAALITASAITAARLGRPWDLPRGDGRAIAITFAAYAAIGLVAGLSPFVLIPIVSGPLRLAFLATLAPATLAVALPVALLPTAATIEQRSRESWPARGPWLVGALCALSMGALMAHVGWLVPAANVEFRTRAASAAAGREWAPPRGVRELTAPELTGWVESADVGGDVTSATRRQEAMLRVTLATLWPATFALFGWRLSRYRGTRTTMGFTAWWCVAVVTVLVVSFGMLGPGSHRLPSVVAVAVTWLLAAALLRRPREHGALRQ